MRYIIITALMLLTIATQAQTKARILENLKNDDSTFNLRYELYITIPAKFIAIPDKESTFQSLKQEIPEIERIDGNMVVFRCNDKFYNYQNEASIKAFIQTKWLALLSKLNTIQINASDWILGQTFDGSTWKNDE
jgi:hypothetical protein